LARLVYGGKYSTPQLAKMLKLSPSLVEYHLKKLVEMDVVKVTNPSSGGVRQYGRKYYLNPKYQPRTARTLLLTAATFFFIILSIAFTITYNSLNLPTLLLLFPSLLGAFYTLKRYRQQYSDALNNILAEISKISK